MAIELLDEHEQSERVRNWFRNNFGSIIIGLAGGIGAIWAWGYFQDWRDIKRSEASNEYTRYLAAIESKDEEAIKTSGDKLRSQYPDTAYAVLSAMGEAETKLSAAAKTDTNSAIPSLAWANQHAQLPELRDLAALRLARVQYDAGNLDAALELATKVNSKGFAAQASELKGDVYLTQGKMAEARSAYEQSLLDLDASSARRRSIEMKRDDLPVTGAVIKAGV